MFDATFIVFLHFLDHVRSTRKGNTFTRVCNSVHVGSREGKVGPHGVPPSLRHNDPTPSLDRVTPPKEGPWKDDGQRDHDQYCLVMLVLYAL